MTERNDYENPPPRQRGIVVTPPVRSAASNLVSQVSRRPTGEAIAMGAYSRQQEKGSSMIGIMFILGLLMLVGGVALFMTAAFGSAASLGIGAMALGTILVLLSFAMLVVTKMYRKASANMAFVRTGKGGGKAIKDGGALVIPVLHTVIPVSLETMRLNVERKGVHALITKDNLRVDLSAEFYIKVQANENDIIQAARSLGGKNVQPDAVSELVQEKLVSALRTVAATKELVELHSKRDEFATAVQQIVVHDLAHNGLTLESVTISSLDQTDPSQLQERNVFDAQGLRKIAEITQRARIERNEIERDAEQKVATKNVETRKQVLELGREQAEAEAEQKMKVANVNAAREREIAEFKIQQDEAVAKRDIEKSRQLQMSEVQRKLVVEQAEIDKQTTLVGKQREQQQAEVLRKQALEVAERTRETVVAQKEQETSTARAGALLAEAEREKAAQAITTVQVTSEASREAEKKLIAAKQIINENKIREETNADVMAYMQIKEADAEKQAAAMRYDAKVKLAEGDAAAASKKAEGDTAVKMVDVNVEKQRVAVESARVEVERVSLSNRSEFEDAALKFELEKLRIQADKEVRIAAAQAMANMFAKAQMTIFGDPNTMASMSTQFMKAAGYGAAAEGLMKTLPPEAKDLLSNLGEAVVDGMKAKKSAAEKDGKHGAVPPVVDGKATASTEDFGRK